MISRRDVSREHPTEELDGLIQRALREKVARASPSPRVWNRIRERAENSKVRTSPISHRNSRVGMAQLARVFFRLNAFLFAQIASWIWPRNEWVEWRLDPYFSRLLIDQYGGLFLLRVAF